MSDVTTESRLPKTRPGVRDENLDKADDLLDRLSPRGADWQPDPKAWIFHGHGDADWELKARAIREPAALGEYGYPPTGTDWVSIGAAERALLKRFKESLNEQGLHVPSDPYALRALAQHHRLPTILFDWTRRAFVAAYFAAVQALEEETAKRRVDYLGVWALYAPSGHSDIRVFEPHASTNPNLRAQSGIFLDPSQFSIGGQSLEVEIARNRPQTTSVVWRIRRFNLRTTQARRLLRLLSYEGITGASMFPGADGVVKAMRERALCDDGSDDGQQP